MSIAHWLRDSRCYIALIHRRLWIVFFTFYGLYPRDDVWVLKAYCRIYDNMIEVACA